MVIASIVLFIAAGVCLLFVFILRNMFSREETKDIIVEGTVLEYRTEDRPTMEKPVVSFVIGGEEIQAYADSVPVKGRPQIGEKVKLAVRRYPLIGNENNWHAAVVNEGKELPFIQKFFYGLMVLSVILIVIGIVLLFIYFCL